MGKIISDETHAVDASAAVVVTTADAPQPAPAESAWYLTVQASSGNGQVLRFDSVDARDRFYKELVNAMGG